MSTPAIRAIGYPCRCLCLGLVQMTITVPRRRITLQLSQRALTEALTFNGSSFLLEPVGDPASGQVVWRKLDTDPVTRQDPDEVHPELAADVGEHPVAILQLDCEHRVGERFDDRSFHFDRISLGHRLRASLSHAECRSKGTDTRTRSVSKSLETVHRTSDRAPTSVLGAPHSGSQPELRIFKQP